MTEIIGPLALIFPASFADVGAFAALLAVGPVSDVDVAVVVVEGPEALLVVVLEGAGEVVSVGLGVVSVPVFLAVSEVSFVEIAVKVFHASYLWNLLSKLYELYELRVVSVL